jgi:pyruvate dehydrogenase E1 component
MQWSFDYMQRDGSEEKQPGEVWHREEKGGSVYLRLTTRPLDQPTRPMTAELRDAVIGGGYWLRRPDPGTQAAIAYTGALAPEAIEAAGLLSEDRRGAGVLAVTSADRLSAGWHAAQRAREQGNRAAVSHVETLLSALPRDAGLITVTDAHPEALSWLGGVLGHRVRALGVEHFGQSGSIPELYGAYGLDVNAILAAAEGLGASPVRYRFLQT